VTALVTGAAVGAHRLDPRVGRRRSRSDAGLQLLVHVRKYFPHPNGGAENSLHSVVLGLRDLGHQMTVVSETAPEPYVVDGIGVVPSSPRARAEHYRRADAVLSVIDPPARDVRVDALRHGTALVMFDFSGAVVGDRPRAVDLWVLNADWIRPQLPGSVADHTVVVHSQIEPARYRTEPGGEVTLVNLSEWKGAHQFYEMARRLPEFRFLGVQGAWGEQIDPPPLANLTVVANQPDARAVFRRTRILALPSRSEVHPRSPLEAAVSGIPCVAHPSPGAIEALGPAGVYVHRDDLDGWCREIRRLHDPVEHTDAASRSRSWATTTQIAHLGELTQLVAALERLVVR
jgi:glycosyltransferase involved in cell wall biosynthesis